MSEHVHLTGECADTATWADDREIIEATFVLRTGDRKNAGTDANVTFRIGDRSQSYSGQVPGAFERGHEDVRPFTWNFRPVPLGAVRGAAISISHDRSGEKPGWFIESVCLKLRAVGDDTDYLYKEWRGIGWLAVDEPPGTTSVILQQSSTGQQPPAGNCGHQVPEPDCRICKRRWPHHPGQACTCKDCLDEYQPS